MVLLMDRKDYLITQLLFKTMCRFGIIKQDLSIKGMWRGDTKPRYPNVGDMFCDTTQNTIFIFDGKSWKNIQL